MRRFGIAAFSLACTIGGLVWQLLDVLGRGEVFFKIPEYFSSVTEFIQHHQEIGYQIAPWVFMSIGLAIPAFAEWPQLAFWRRKALTRSQTSAPVFESTLPDWTIRELF